MVLICLNRATKSKFSNLVTPNPMIEAPWEST